MLRKGQVVKTTRVIRLPEMLSRRRYYRRYSLGGMLLTLAHRKTNYFAFAALQHREDAWKVKLCG